MAIGRGSGNLHPGEGGAYVCRPGHRGESGPRVNRGKACAAVILLAGLVLLGDAHAVRPLARFKEYDPRVFRDGDLVFRKGKGFFSRFFAEAGSRAVEYSHVGLVTLIDGEVQVIHTEASELTGRGRAKREPLEDFLSDENAFSGDLFRLRGITGTQEATVVRAASGFVEQETPFDADFDLASRDRLYCTELVWRAYREAGLDVPGERDSLSVPTGSGRASKEIISLWNLMNGRGMHLVANLKKEER